MKKFFQNSKTRHLAKTITWRIIGTLDTVLLGYFFTGDLSIGLKIGSVELISKMLLYYIHERAWYKSDLGIERKK
jgi:uncharacterized membrane protein